MKLGRALIVKLNLPFSSVPRSLQQLFVELGGRIIVSPASAEICANFFKSSANAALSDQPEERKSLPTCAVYFPKSDVNHQILNIHLPPVGEEISHGLVKAFGALAVEFYPKIRRTADGFSFVLEDPDDFAAKRDLAFSVILDIYRNPALDFTYHIPAFGNLGMIEAAQFLKQHSDERVSSSKFFEAVSFRNSKDEIISAETRTGRETRAVNFFAIEAFDSFYCNSWSERKESIVTDVLVGKLPVGALLSVHNTNYIMEKMFPLSFGEFRDHSAGWILSMTSGLLGDKHDGRVSLADTGNRFDSGSLSSSTYKTSIAFPV